MTDWFTQATSTIGRYPAFWGLLQHQAGLPAPLTKSEGLDASRKRKGLNVPMPEQRASSLPRRSASALTSASSASVPSQGGSRATSSAPAEDQSGNQRLQLICQTVETISGCVEMCLKATSVPRELVASICLLMTSVSQLADRIRGDLTISV